MKEPGLFNQGKRWLHGDVRGTLQLLEVLKITEPNFPARTASSTRSNEEMGQQPHVTA